MSEASAKKSPHMYTSETPSASTPQSINSTTAAAGTPPLDGDSSFSANGASEAVGSPFKKQRASLPGLDGAMLSALNDATPANNVGPQPQTSGAPVQPAQETVDEDEEL